MMFWILTLTLCEVTFAVDADSMPHNRVNIQPMILTEVFAELTERLDGLTKHVHELTRVRDSNGLAMTTLNKNIENLKMSRDQDERVMTQMATHIEQLTKRVEELEYQCDIGQQEMSDDSQPKPRLVHANAVFTNTTEMTSRDRVPDTTDNVGIQPKDTRKPNVKSVRGDDRIKARYHSKQARVSASDAVVAFHAILTHPLNGLATDQIIKYNNLVTNTGGAHYSSNTGVFTCTQAGVHVFSWSLSVAGNTYMYADLVCNNDVLGSTIAGENTVYWSDSSAIAALHLEVGDEVWVRVATHSGGANINPKLSMFTGFRLG